MGKRGVTLGPNHSKAYSIHSCSEYTMIHPKIGSYSLSKKSLVPLKKKKKQLPLNIWYVPGTLQRAFHTVSLDTHVILFALEIITEQETASEAK